MIIVDGSHLLHRILFVPKYQEMIDSNGNASGGIHGFMVSLDKIVRESRKREGLVVAWDSGIPLHRRELNREYKPHKRPVGVVNDNYLSEMNLNPEEYEEFEKYGGSRDENFMDQYRYCRDILHRDILPLTGTLSLRVPNTEADDIISVWTHHYRLDEVTIVSSDRDLIQLVEEYVYFKDPVNHKLYDRNLFLKEKELEKYGDKWRSVWLFRRALIGDDSDNIKGISGIGKKTAKKYADQYYELRKEGLGFYDTFDEFERPKGANHKAHDKLLESGDHIRRNILVSDLKYPIRANLELYQNIRTAFLQSSIHEVDRYTLEDKLHRMGLMKNKRHARNICEANQFDNMKNNLESFLQ